MGQTFTNGGVIYDILRSLKQQRSVKKQNKRKYSALALNLIHAMYLRFVVCFFVEVVVVVVWLYLFCFLLTVTCFFVCSFFPCLLVFCRCECYFCLLLFFFGCMPIPNLQGAPFKIPKMLGVMLPKVYILSYLIKN